MGKIHDKSEGLDVNLYYSNLEITLNCLKDFFFLFLLVDEAMDWLQVQEESW